MQRHSRYLGSNRLLRRLRTVDACRWFRPVDSASPAANHLDVVGDSEPGAGPAGEGLPVIHLVLQGSEEACGGVIPIHPGPVDAGTPPLAWQNRANSTEVYCPARFGRCGT